MASHLMTIEVPFSENIITYYKTRNPDLPPDHSMICYHGIGKSSSPGKESSELTFNHHPSPICTLSRSAA